MAKKKKAKVRIELLRYISENINQLEIPDRRIILGIIINDQGESRIEECADGCRIIANNLSDSAIDKIIDYMGVHID